MSAATRVDWYHVRKDGVLQFTGTYDNSFRFVHDAQDMSVTWACQHGWTIVAAQDEEVAFLWPQ